MLKDKTLTYVSLFSSAGVGCYGFKQEDFVCIATNEFIKRRLDVQQYNHKCLYDTGYICGDIKAPETQARIFNEIERFAKEGNDSVDVLIATPPCQGMSVANHKKHDNEIDRNSLVVESIILTKEIKPKFFLFENVSAFLTTGCTAPDKTVKAIKQVIQEELGNLYEIKARILNFKNYGSNSSRTRTVVIGVRKDYEELISAIDLFPHFVPEKSLRNVIGSLPPLSWGEINEADVLHAFRTYPKEMEQWIDGIPELASAFDNEDELKRPHKVVDGKIIPNIHKNGDKYTRQAWDKVGPCIHTRNDQLASQNTIHPRENRVFSVRELMMLMTIPSDFRWASESYEELNKLSLEEKQAFYKKHEINIRQCIGEAVPTTIFRQIAHNIREQIFGNDAKLNVKKVIEENNLSDKDNLIRFLKDNPQKYSVAILSKIAEMANAERTDNAAYYTNKSLLNYIYEQLPEADADTIRILEPSVGVGNFIPFLFRKYEAVPCVNLDIVDIDSDSLKITEMFLSKVGVPSNFHIQYFCSDFMLYESPNSYFLVVGNPPFLKVRKSEFPHYFKGMYNTDTTNLAALFLEKSMKMSKNVVMIEPKYVINTIEFQKTREFLSKHKIRSIFDFGEKGFKGVLIETVCIAVQTNAKAGKNDRVDIRHITLGIRNLPLQKELVSEEYPYWILYRNQFFDDVAKTLIFDVFYVFRDRQISNKDLLDQPAEDTVRVLKSRNISRDGTILSIPGYDGYIRKDLLMTKGVSRYLDDMSVFLVPNMTYYPRMIRNPKNVTVNGSVAVLIPKSLWDISEEQIQYFASDEYREFYRIARNYQTRSLNIDETSVFFFGLKQK